MDYKKVNLIILTLFLAIIFPVTIMYLSRIYTLNIANGLGLIFLLAIIVGLITPNLILSWLMIITTSIAIGFLFLGYIVMPTFSKIILVIAFPVEASLVSVLSNFIIPWSYIVGRNRKIRKFLSHYNFTLNLQTEYNAKKLYRRHIKILKENPKLGLNINLMMIHWENYEQYKEMNPTSYDKLLKKITHILKANRLTEEFIYYLGNATFLINSPNLEPRIFNQVNLKTENKLFKLPEPIPTSLKVVNLYVDNSNLDKYDTPEKMLKHLERELETTIIVEYLKGGRKVSE
ncbi:hypothetical protein J2Z60_001511 [Lactobacillus colini]|uniref:Uncharacterized protein n=1 Tax=Lactobacillus colini TaxID=1819254 RepID=A0ABS4MF59_9LACO|nr:hypothetical protein [Lactobacillus colini]MBP2058332.1 hypothetical protein [Lactobacillus colini]